MANDGVSSFMRRLGWNIALRVFAPDPISGAHQAIMEERGYRFQNVSGSFGPETIVRTPSGEHFMTTDMDWGSRPARQQLARELRATLGEALQREAAHKLSLQASASVPQAHGESSSSATGKGGRYSAIKVPVVGAAIAVGMAYARGADAKEMVDAGARATPGLNTLAAVVDSSKTWGEVGARAVGDITLGIGEQALKEALPGSGLEPGIAAQARAQRDEDQRNPVAVANPPTGASPMVLRQKEKIDQTGHGWRSASEAPHTPMVPKI